VTYLLNYYGHLDAINLLFYLKTTCLIYQPFVTPSLNTPIPSGIAGTLTFSPDPQGYSDGKIPAKFELEICLALLAPKIKSKTQC
jgi:hypothetical protein